MRFFRWLQATLRRVPAYRWWEAKVQEPVITDRSVDVMAAAVWFCLAGWGIASTVTGLPTISKSTSPMYEVWWGAAIGALGAVACVAAVSMFVSTSNVHLRIVKKSVELVTVAVLFGFVAVYPTFMIVLAFAGDSGRAASSFASVVYLIVPAWRARHLFLRIRKLRELAELST